MASSVFVTLGSLPRFPEVLATSYAWMATLQPVFPQGVRFAQARRRRRARRSAPTCRNDMAIARLALAQVAWRARPGAAAALLGTTTTAGLLARARQRRACAAGGAVCDSLEREPERWRRPAAGTSGACPQSGVRFYAARSRKAAESMHCYAIAEDLHQFSIVDGMPDVGLCQVWGGGLMRLTSDVCWWCLNSDVPQPGRDRDTGSPLCAPRN